MPDASSLPFPYLDQAQAPAWMDAQRKQQMAQMLMSAFQQSNQTPENWNSMRQVPKRGMLGNVATLANALMAGKAQNTSFDANSNYLKEYYGAGQPQQPPPSTGPGAGIINPDAPPAAQDAAQSVTAGNVPSGNLPQPPAPQNPMIPQGMGRGTANALIGMMGPQEYAKTIVAPQFTPLEIQRQLTAAGIDPNSPQGRDIIGRTLQKGAYIAPIEQREGSIERDPMTNAVIGQNPKTPAGGVNFYDPAGNLTGAGMVPGATNMISQSSGAETAGKVANTPQEIDMGGGVKALRYPGDVPGVGAPPALRFPQGPSVNRSGPPQQQRTSASVQPSSVALPQKDSSGIFSSNLWPDIPKMVVPSSPGQTSNDYQKAIVTGSATKHQDLVNKLGEQSAAGTQQLEYLTEAEKALPKAEVGPMTDYLTHNRGLLIQTFPSLANALGGEKVSPTLELNKQLTNAALQGARTTFGARMTQNEVKLQTEEMSPSVEMTHDALVSLIHQAKMKAAYGIQQDKDYADYHAQNGDPNRFESQYNVRRPITRFAAQYDTPPSAIERLRQNPSLLPDFKSRYGWDPTK